MSVTSLDVHSVNLVDHELTDDPLLTLDALADAADRLPPVPSIPNGATRVLPYCTRTPLIGTPS